MHRWLKTGVFGGVCLMLLSGCSWSMPAVSPGSVSSSVRAEALGVLRDAVAEQSDWVKIHAAEGLLWSGEAGNLSEVFAAELETAESPYRVGVLRVLAQAAGDDAAARAEYLRQVLAIFNDAEAPDRLHALETLAKLGYAERTAEVLAAAEPEAGRFQVYARWVLANSDQREDEAPLADLLGGDDALLRQGAAYALRHRQSLSPESVAALATALAAQADDEPKDIYLQSAWYVHGPAEDELADRSALLSFLGSDQKHERNEVCLALAYAGGDRDVPTLVRLLRNDPEADVRVYAAFALLRMDDRSGGK